jgi:hypothetical protein
MATLSADKPRVFENQGNVPVYNDLPAAVDIVYAGSAVGISSGYAQPCTTSDEFAGFCVEKCDNSGGSAGTKRAKVLSQGYAVLTVVGSSAVTHVNDTVYLTDDDTFTLTASGALAIGKVFRWVVSTTCVVYFEALGNRSI